MFKCLNYLLSLIYVKNLSNICRIRDDSKLLATMIKIICYYF